MIEIQVNGLIKSFEIGKNVLDGLTFQIDQGERVGLLGKNGAGKTTLFRIMLDLMRANSGAVLYRENGRQIRFHNIAEHIAYMPQSQSLYADLSVDEHLDFFRKLYGISDADFAHKKDELVRLARLGNFLDRPAGKLSGGMYKKLGLICALLRSPQIMLLDEPTNGIDPISRREFWGLLHDSVAQGILVLMSTAYMDEAERCGGVVLMERGHVLAAGAPDALLEKYNSRNFDDLFIRRGGSVR